MEEKTAIFCEGLRNYFETHIHTQISLPATSGVRQTERQRGDLLSACDDVWHAPLLCFPISCMKFVEVLKLFDTRNLPAALAMWTQQTGSGKGL